MAAHLKSRAGNGRPTRIGEAILAGLSRDGTLTVAANVPHVIGRKDDYAVPIHGDDRGIPAVLVGMRQDLPADHQGVEAWAKRLAAALPAGQTA